MRSFLLASFALCLTWGLSGCDAPVEPAKTTTPATPPAASSTSEPTKPGAPTAPEGRMEPTTPAPAPAPDKPAEPAPK